MINRELCFVLLVGMSIMIIPIAVQMKWYGVARWKSLIVSFVLVWTGVIGSYIWFYIENLSFGGRSFYGAIFFVPAIFFPVARILRIPYGYALDFCAPAGCMTLALVKLQCLRDGCCQGRILYLDANRVYVRFPSQIIEMIAFLVISCLLLHISSREKRRSEVFVYFLVLYGGSRFFLDFFRADIAPYVLGLSAGSFWSLCAFLIGCMILLIMQQKDR